MRYLFIILTFIFFPFISNGQKNYGDVIKFDKDYVEGPHITNISDNIYEVSYFLSSSRTAFRNKRSKMKKAKKNILEFKSFAGKKEKLRIPTTFKIDKWEHNNIPKVLVIGDTHGIYYSLTDLLKTHKVITKENKWNFGNGHIVFMGDIFDRGDRVTETLWFVFNLSIQAEKAGGKVHLLLGNHEIMVMNKDYRYVNDKYKNLCFYYGIDYSEMFSKNTVLGKWLRSQNSVIKINNKVYVHAGISPKLLNLKLPIDSINYKIRTFLNSETSQIMDPNTRTLFKSNGIFWYRGYFKKSKRYNKITELELDNILKFYKANSIIVGHTEVDEFTNLFKDKIFAVNIPFNDDKIEKQIILFENKDLYILYENGNKIKLKL